MNFWPVPETCSMFKEWPSSNCKQVLKEIIKNIAVLSINANLSGDIQRMKTMSMIMSIIYTIHP